MKLIANARLKGAQDKMQRARPFSVGSSKVMDGFVDETPQNKNLIIAITSDRGLCGAINSSIVKTTRYVHLFFCEFQLILYKLKIINVKQEIFVCLFQFSFNINIHVNNDIVKSFDQRKAREGRCFISLHWRKGCFTIIKRQWKENYFFSW